MASTKPFEPLSVQPQLLRVLSSRLSSASYDRDRDRLKALAEEVSEDVRRLMIEQSPQGYKYVVVTQIVENKGQAGRASLSTHWDDQSDSVVREVWSNDTLLVTVIAFAVRVAY